MKKKNLLFFTLSMMFFVALFALLVETAAFAEPTKAKEEKEQYKKDRYTVLILDVAGKNVFEVDPIFMIGRPIEYVTDSATDDVKASAIKFINDARYSIDNNYIAVVAYAEDATVISAFTDDYNGLESAVESIQYEKENDNLNNITAGLECADQLLSGISDNHVTKNVLLCTTGLVDEGKHNYEGQYGEDTIGSKWCDKGTWIRLYAFANCAIEAANALKNNHTTIYVIGIHQPIESSLPSESRDIAEFFRITAKDIASSEDTYFCVEDIEDIEFVFGELQDDITGTSMIRIYNDSDAYKSDVAKEYPGEDSEIRFGGYYEDMAWGNALFEIPATKMHLQSITSPDSPNYNLAMVSGNLCITSYNADYLKQAYNILGFEDENISFYSYPEFELNRPDALRNGQKFANDADLAFSIASKEIVVDGEKTDLVIITLRGTQEKWEAIKDATCEADKDFYGYMAWDWVYEFEEDVFAGLEDYYHNHSSLGNRPLKILVTGHSLGGAGANLVAAKLNKEVESDNWYSKNTALDDIYAYTFGAIDSISKDKTNKDIFKYIEVPVVNGFENIINIYNYLDTFGPRGKGYYGFTAAGNTMYGKFGLFNTFTDNMKKVINSDSPWPTHEIVGYVYSIKSGWLDNDIKTNKIKIWIRCPVDVEIFEGSELICRTASNEIVKETSEVIATVENGAKTFILSKDHDYKLILTGTDSGTMSYSVQDLDNNDPSLIDYQGVSLEPGKKMVSELSRNTEIENIELFVVDKNEKYIAKVSTNGAETKIDGKKNYISIYIILFIATINLIIAGILLVIIRRKKKMSVH